MLQTQQQYELLPYVIEEIGSGGEKENKSKKKKKIETKVRVLQ